MQERFSEITKQLQAKMPTWSSIRYDKTTVGARLLNVFGLQFEDIRDYLQYALDNYHVTTADENQIDVIYKARIPKSIRDNMKLIVHGNDRQLTKMDTLRMFYEGIDNRHLERKEVYYPNPFFIDWERHIIYTRYSYAPDANFPEGKISIRIMNEEKLLFEHDLRQEIHHVWNFFDEFGLLVGINRLYGERNRDYKRRILDVFLHKPNASHIGMVNSIASELDLRRMIHREIGEDQKYKLEYTNVVPETVRVDRTENPEGYEVSKEDGEVEVALGNYYSPGDIGRIDFVSGLRLHEFHNSKDDLFQSILYDVEGVGTPMLKYYIEVIKQRVPTMWNEFIWNESFWNIADESMSGYGVVPTFKDAKFLSWANYEM